MAQMNLKDMTMVVNGKELSTREIMDVVNTWGIMSTAEFIMENMDLDEANAINKANEVRDYMDKHEVTETEALLNMMWYRD